MSQTTDPTRPASLLIIAPETGVLLEALNDLATRLKTRYAASHEQIVWLDHADAAHAYFEDESITHDPVAAIIATTEHQSLFAHLHNQQPYPIRPLLILLLDTPTLNAHADLTLSPHNPDALAVHVLQAVYQWQSANHYAKQQHHEIDHLQAALQKERRIKDELEVLKNAIVRNVSHELKTPLLQVKSAVALLGEDHQDPEKTAQLIELAINATTRLELLVRNITMLSGSLEVNLSPIILTDAIEAARRYLRRMWEHRDHVQRVMVNIPPNLPPLLADKQGLSIILQLLLDNALKFSKENVIISAQQTGDYVLVQVQDEGIGIAEEQLEQVFDIFYQVDSSSTRRYGGTGVGLAIVRLILENHGSQIYVASALNQGSVFSFKLPIVKLS